MLILFICLVFASSMSAQNGSFTDDYSSTNNQPPVTQLPSDEYYNKNLRSGWDDDDPGGSGEGSDTGVGVPIGDGGYILLFSIGVYGAVLFVRKRRFSALLSNKE